jgi:hypothetical protein
MLNLITPKNKLPRRASSNYSETKSNKNSNGCKMTSIRHAKLSMSPQIKRKTKKPEKVSRRLKDL